MNKVAEVTWEISPYGELYGLLNDGVKDLAKVLWPDSVVGQIEIVTPLTIDENSMDQWCEFLGMDRCVLAGKILILTSRMLLDRSAGSANRTCEEICELYYKLCGLIAFENLKATSWGKCSLDVQSENATGQSLCRAMAMKKALGAEGRARHLVVPYTL